MSLRDRAIEAHEQSMRTAEATQRANRAAEIDYILKQFHAWAKGRLGIVDFEYVSVNDAGDQVTAVVDGVTLYFRRFYKYDYGYQTEEGVEMPCGKCSEPVSVRAYDLEQIGRVLSESAFHTRCPEREGEIGEAPLPTVAERPRMTETEQAFIDALRTFLAVERGEA
jgi:hypothetical protein